MHNSKMRDAAFDNLRFTLISLVVFGHILEIGGWNEHLFETVLYFGIYCFHMPAFLFLSGYFGKFSWKRIIRFGGIYFLFQTFYSLFRYVETGGNAAVQYLTPYWHLWYLFVLIYCCLLIPLMQLASVRMKAVIIGISLAVSLMAGYSNEIGYPLSLSRFLVFLPYYLIGYMVGCCKDAVKQVLLSKPNIWMLTGLASIILMAVLYLRGVQPAMLYGSNSYSIGYGPFTRFLIFITAMLAIAALLSIFVTRFNCTVPLLTEFGRNTLPVFLLHGFLVRILHHLPIRSADTFLMLLLAVLLIAVSGNSFVRRIFAKLRLT